MALKYGVLVGRPIARQLGQHNSPHYQIHIVDDTTDYRIAVNVRSQDGSDLMYFMDEDFKHHVTQELAKLSPGFHPLKSAPGGLALDFIRGNLFDRDQMRALPADVPGPDNDLNDEIDKYVQRAMGDETVLVYAFGDRWGPEAGKKDAYFGFLPGNGIHDIHMNQGNPPGSHAQDNGVYQDGALLVHFPPGRGAAAERWIAIFLKFQTQAWHTDDATGNVLPGADERSSARGERDQPGGAGSPGAGASQPGPNEPDGKVRVISALVSPAVSSRGIERVTLLNVTSAAIDLTGWRLADTNKNVMALTGTLAPGETKQVPVVAPIQLSSRGGIITLLNDKGLKVDGVAYTAAQAKEAGVSIVF